jgi:O-antigen ligase
LVFLCVTLLGYALFGKGWAYVGVPPLYIGEAVLLCGVVWYFTLAPAGLLSIESIGFLLLLSGWGMLRTWPYVSTYGIDALRDAVIWGYCAFAIILFAYIRADPTRLQWLLERYRQFTAIFLVGIPIVWMSRYLLANVMPHWPWADVPVVDARAGDILVHLSGILAFWVAGFDGRIGFTRAILLAGCVAVIGAYERAGLVAFAICFAVCFCCRPSNRLLHRLVGVGCVGLILLAVSGIRFEVPSPESTKVREVSFEYVLANVLSVVADTDVGDLDDTKQWRLDWWNEILDYTLRGRYFWVGKGFGINLADDDGFQVMANRSLRSPHNGHLTMLARAGVPGLALWAMAQLSWAYAVIRAYRESRRCCDGQWSSLFLFLFVYWLAFMTNASFDVFIEGPMGGVWFWVIYGVGLSAVWLYRHCPEVLYETADSDGPQLLPAARRGGRGSLVGGADSGVLRAQCDPLHTAQ